MNQNIDFIPFARPSLSPAEEKAVLQVLRGGWLTTGRVARAFEEEFAAFTGARYALAVNSATAGLHLSLEALRVRRGSLVLTTPYTFTATAEIANYLGADPLFVDIDGQTCNIDPRQMEVALKKQGRDISAMIPVHLGGLPCAMDEIMELAAEHEVPVVEDAAHTFPVKTPGGLAGTLGQCGVYSFYATKTITTGEGGMVVTDDSRLAERIGIMRLHGIDREAWDRHSGRQEAWYYQVVAAGFKYNMPDVLAALGREQLKRATVFMEKRRRIAARYLRELADCYFLKLPATAPHHAWHLFILGLQPDSLTISRDDFIRELQARGIGTSVHYIPLHIMPYYRDKYGFKPEDFPVALRTFQHSLSLPIYPDLRPEQVSRIITAVKDIGRLRSRRLLYQGAEL